MEAKEVVVKRVGFYEIDRTIGRGNFAVVKLAKHRITKSQLAIKMIDKKQLDETNLKKVYREVKILKMLDHPNIIKLYQVMETDQFIYLVSEYAPNGELFDFIAKNGKMSESDARKMFWQIICAVDYCHLKGVVHRDLKAENLLLGLDMSVKIADFGFGNFFKPGEELSTWCGSPPYAAPEVFEGHKYYGPEVDIWSLGVVLYVLVCGAFPFDGETLHALRDRVVSGRFRIPYFMSSDCENLIRKMLVVDPKRRFNITQIRQHRWNESMYAREDLIMRFHDIAISDLNRPKISEIYNEYILTTMENAGINRHSTIEALKSDEYNNFYAIYNLLLDKLKQQQYSRKLFSEFGHSLSDACPRRPSTIADQAVICPGHRAPVLAETKQVPFSQTTDCVQLHEVPGAVCQRQQMLYTDPSSGRPLLPPRVGRVVPVGRVFPQASVGRAIATTSIDEGVEADYDEESDGSKEMVGQIPVPPTGWVAESTGYLTKADMYGYFGRVGLPNQPSGNAATSFDSNIELDAISNVSSSPSGSIINSSTMSADATEAPECSGDVLEEESTDDQKDSRLFVDFREGRRASDGLMVRGVLEFQQHLKKSMKTRGVAELRKELEKLQLETSGDYETKFRVRPGRLVDIRNIQQKSLEESCSTVRGPNLVIKRTSLPFVDYGTLVLQKRLAMRHGLQSGICYEPSHSAVFVQDSDVVRVPLGISQHVPNLKPIKSQPLQVMPYCTSPNRQLWLLQTSMKQTTHQMQHQTQELGEDGCSARFGQFQSRMPHMKEDQSLAQNADNPISLQSLSPNFRHSEMPGFHMGLSTELFPIASSHQPKTIHFVPTCRSQGNLSDYGTGVDLLQSRESASVGTLLKHPTYCGGTVPTATATETHEPDATKRHMVRRTLFRLVQQQTLVSPCGEDVDELNLGDIYFADPATSNSNVAKTDPSTSMDIS